MLIFFLAYFGGGLTIFSSSLHGCALHIGSAVMDGKPPRANHGMDADTDSKDTITEQRLYQFIRRSGRV